MSVMAGSNISTFNTLALHCQDEAFTLAYYFLGDEDCAVKATQAAFDDLYQHTRFPMDGFRLILLRRVLECCLYRGGSPNPVVLSGARRGDMPQMLMRLKMSERSAAVLVDVLGLSYAEAARVLGSSNKQVARLLAQARLKLSTPDPIRQ